MRCLTGPADAPEGELTDDDLRRLYAAPRTPWLRVNMISTVDGAATGDDGRTGSINNAVDKRVFDLLRDLADAVVVGAGTATIEGYAPDARPTVVVSRSGRVPPRLRDGAPGDVLLVTCSSAEHLAESRDLIGADHVLVVGGHRVDLAAARTALADRGLVHLLCEGGPHLLRDLLDQEAADEVCATTVPTLVGGLHPRITVGPPLHVPLRLGLLLEEQHTLLARWYVVPA